jgi:hypothetical protein
MTTDNQVDTAQLRTLAGTIDGNSEAQLVWAAADELDALRSRVRDLEGRIVPGASYEQQQFG